MNSDSMHAGMMGMSTMNGGLYNGGPPTSTSTSSSNSVSSTAWHNCRKMIYVPRAVQRGSPSGFWPIPESFWPDVNTLSLVSKIIY